MRILCALYGNFISSLNSSKPLSPIYRLLSAPLPVRIFRHFEQWIHRSGAPNLRLQQAEAAPAAQGFKLKARIEQTQPGKPYHLTVPVAVTLEGEGRAYSSQITINQKTHVIEMDFHARPVRIDIDPQFDVFRRLDSREIPSALSQGFGAE